MPEYDDTIPYVAFGNDEIEEFPSLVGPILCDRCGEYHELRYGKKVLPDGTKIEDDMLAFVACGDTSYLVGVDGKDVRSSFKRK